MSATTEAVTISITMPLPPASLSPNGREFWAVRNHDAQRWRTIAAGLIASQRVIGQHNERDWPGTVMNILWQFAGKQPDDDNVIGRCKAIRDGIADAGLVADDALIRVGTVTFQRVPRKDQAVTITLTREQRKSAKPSQYIHCRWKVGEDAYHQHELIELDEPGYWPSIIGRSDVAAHIVRIHNRWLDRRMDADAEERTL
jgi:crossover junction endodeoxyribonuclease RusA